MSRRQRTQRLREQALEEDVLRGSRARFHSKSARELGRRPGQSLACDAGVHGGTLRTRLTSMQGDMAETFDGALTARRARPRRLDAIRDDGGKKEEKKRGRIVIRISKPRGISEMPETKRMSMHHIMAYRGDLLADALYEYAAYDFIHEARPRVGDPLDRWVGSTLADAFLDYIDTWKDSRYEDEGDHVADTVLAVMRRFAVTRNSERRRAVRRTNMAEAKALSRRHHTRDLMAEHEEYSSDGGEDVYVGRRRRPHPESAAWNS